MNDGSWVDGPARINGNDPQWVDGPIPIPAGATIDPEQSNLSQNDGLLDKAGHLIEDIAYPPMGAIAGAMAGGIGGAETGSGDLVTTLAGGALGATAGNEVKRGMRAARGRSDLNPQGWGPC